MRIKGKEFSDWILPFGVLGMLVFLLAATSVRFIRQGNTEGFPPRSEESFSETGVDGIVDGSFQEVLGEWFTDNFFGHSAAVSLHNQINYSVFGDASERWVCGKDRYLFSAGQVEMYIQRKDKLWEPQDYEEYAKKVYKMQTALEAAGKAFVYILTPNKTEIYPERLPWRDRWILEHEVDKEKGSHNQLVEAFVRNGVHFYDCTEDILRMKEEADFDAFARTGHHWTFTACAEEMNAIFAGIQPWTPGITYPEVQVVGMSDEVCSYDLDILQSQKVWFGHNRDVVYRSPVIAYPKMSEEKVFWFGTSYGALFTIALYQGVDARAFERLAFQQYFTGLYVFDGEGISAEEFTEEDTPEDIGVMENIRNDDLLIMEQQADSGIYPTHVKFVDYVNACLEGLD